MLAPSQVVVVEGAHGGHEILSGSVDSEIQARTNQSGLQGPHISGGAPVERLHGRGAQVGKARVIPRGAYLGARLAG